MKILAPLLILFLIYSGLSPCNEDLFFGNAETAQVTTDHCSDTELSHGCCTAAEESDHSPEEDSSCTDGCACYCCAHPLVPLPYFALSLPKADLPVQIDQPSNPYIRDFSYLIWRPPQEGYGVQA